MNIEELPEELDTTPRKTDRRWGTRVEGHTNAERADRAETALSADYLEEEVSFDEAATDLVADLMHLCRRRHEDFRTILFHAVLSHEEERG